MAGYIVDSEYLPLKAVLLCKPCRKMADIDNPEKALHAKKIDIAVINREYGKVIELYKRLGIEIYFVDSRKIQGTDYRYAFNLMFTRDLFFMTPRGAILSRMASCVRRDETLYAGRALKKAGIKIRKAIQGNGTFEGADALWITPRIVAVGVGNRTNYDGFKQIRQELGRDGVRCVCLPAPKGVIHLLGAVQLLDRNLAILRTGLISKKITRFLNKNRIGIIDISETGELKEKQAFNFVVIAPKKIVMPAGCPNTKKTLKRYRIDVVAETRVTQLINGCGGLACATGILARTR